MILGVDLDNTLICYDTVFYSAAISAKLMPIDGPRTKQGVREWLVGMGREADFTRLQGQVYGPGIVQASPYPGALACLSRLVESGVIVYVVSHKTKTPVLGPPYDLRAFAKRWLEENGFIDSGPISFEHIFLEDSLADKAKRAAALGCTHFVDDLPAFFLQTDFPSTARGFLFRPDAGSASGAMRDGIEVFESWAKIEAELFRAV